MELSTNQNGGKPWPRGEELNNHDMTMLARFGSGSEHGRRWYSVSNKEAVFHVVHISSYV